MKKYICCFMITLLLILTCSSCYYNIVDFYNQDTETDSDEDEVRKKLDEIGRQANEEVREYIKNKGNLFITEEPSAEINDTEDNISPSSEVTPKTEYIEKNTKDFSYDNESKPTEVVPSCSYCNGSGKYCKMCNTTGKCHYCEGTGLKNCSRCDGTRICDYCQGKSTVGAYNRDCRYCTDGTCQKCTTGKVECVHCHGQKVCIYCKGTMQCGYCNGVVNYKTESYPSPVQPLSECTKCYGAGYLDCPSCATGKCIECSGRGTIKRRVSSMETEEVDCSYCVGGICRRCNGAREISCPSC